MFKILRSRLHYDVIMTSYTVGWYLFWYQWIEKTHYYTLVANIRVCDVYYRNKPPPEDVLQKIPQEDEG